MVVEWKLRVRYVYATVPQKAHSLFISSPKSLVQLCNLTGFEWSKDLQLRDVRFLCAWKLSGSVFDCSICR